jgi:HAD superfamily hydrolase (TIGR01509 family)
MPLAALIFDVDGTMADTEEAHRVAFNLAFERYRLAWNWSPGAYRELLQITGGKERLGHYIRTQPLSDAERRRLLALVPDLHAEKTRFYSSIVADGAIALRSGVARLIDEARSAGCRLGIASTTTAVNIDALLQATLGAGGRNLFATIACGDQVRAKKPAPDIYRLALRGLGVEPQQAVALEDSANGYRAATAAGVPTVVTTNYWTSEHEFPEGAWVLPGLGDPWQPLVGEPGLRLRHASWLTYAEMCERFERPNGAAASLPAPGSRA